MKEKSHIILIGYMGCGKSTLGKKLAKRLGIDFIDTDAVIESSSKKTIPEIFAELGEGGFRKIEQELIQNLDVEKSVIAVGGGLPCFSNNMEVLNMLGTTIYLNRPAKELKNRLANAKTTRPIIADKSDEELLDFITEQLQEREFYYNQAEIIVDRDNQEIERLIELIRLYER